jgi:D-alanyl-D-alanine dipeptidase
MSRIPTQWLDKLEYSKRLAATLPSTLPKIPEINIDDRARTIPIRDNGEALVKLSQVSSRRLETDFVYEKLDATFIADELYVRETVAIKLSEVADQLPDDFNLRVVDGWRPLAFQRELGEIYSAEFPDLPRGYVSDPDDSHLRAPHTLGAAVDLTLSFEGRALAIGSDFDEFSPRSHLRYLESKPNVTDQTQALARDLRRLLFTSMTSVGFAPLDIEWWHWSYGDQRWAAWADQPESLYAPLEGVT